MSKQINGPEVTLIAAEDLVAFRRVKISGATVVYADAGETGIGTVQAAVDCSEDAHACIRLDKSSGSSKMMAAGIITAGADAYPAQDGKISATANGEPVGTTLEASGADGDIIEVVPKYVGTEVAADSARSRAATALPTAAIWGNFNLVEMRRNPFAGSLLERDFTHGENEPSEAFADASSVIRVIPGAAGEGALSLFNTADHEASETQFPSCPITSSGGAPWALEARLKVSVIDDTKANAFIGLMAGDAILAGDLLSDAGAIADVGAIGFQLKEADGDKLDVVYDKTGQTQNEHAADFATPVADTYLTLGLHYNGTTIQMYLNGVATGTAMSANDIAAADFPSADVLVPTITVKNAHTDDFTVTLDWIRVAQQTA
jgi:hypothetical protein